MAQRFTDEQKSLIVSLYTVDKLSLQQIADRFSTYKASIARVLEAGGILRRAAGRRTSDALSDAARIEEIGLSSLGSLGSSLTLVDRVDAVVKSETSRSSPRW